MATTTFVNKETVIPSAWLNDVDAIVYDLLSNATTAAEARIALGLVIGTNVLAYDAEVAFTDTDQDWDGTQRSSAVTITYSATPAVDFGTGNNFVCTLTGDAVFGAPSNVAAGQGGMLEIIQDETGGHTPTFNAAWDFGDTGLTAMSEDADDIGIFSYYVGANGTTIYAAFVGDF